jgi:hypothetical protein
MRPLHGLFRHFPNRQLAVARLSALAATGRFVVLRGNSQI